MSNCDKIRQEINLYLDNEISPEKKQVIENHLRDCPACQTLFAQERRLEQKLVEIITSDDEVIWNRSIALLKTQNREFITRKTMVLRYLVPVAAAALVMVISGILFVLLPNPTSDLLAEVEKEHQSILNPGVQPIFKADSPDELFRQLGEQYDGEQYDFNISAGYECLIGNKGYQFKGGRIISLLKKHSATQMVISYGDTPISILVLLEKDLSDFPKSAQSYLTKSNEIYQTKFKDSNCAMVRLNENIICAMGAVNPEILKQLLIPQTQISAKNNSSRQLESNPPSTASIYGYVENEGDNQIINFVFYMTDINGNFWLINKVEPSFQVISKSGDILWQDRFKKGCWSILWTYSTRIPDNVKGELIKGELIVRPVIDKAEQLNITIQDTPWVGEGK
ncbi:MAG: zf-HC2 domain-containing protein [Planctomycetota bacterium]